MINNLSDLTAINYLISYMLFSKHHLDTSSHPWVQSHQHTILFYRHLQLKQEDHCHGEIGYFDTIVWYHLL